MRALLLHGVHSALDETDTLYLAAHNSPIAKDGDMERLRRVVELVLAQVDVAYRRVAGFKVAGAAATAQLAVSTLGLSPREEEILFLVSRGRTNMQIAEALGISLFTVKNHVQRIIRKLGTGNRTEAAAIYRTRGGVERMIASGRAPNRLAGRPGASRGLTEGP
jgi:DNA-binding CsgD family transcriptional regulator